MNNAERIKADAEARHRTDGVSQKRRPMLRSAALDYSRGWFFVTIQAAFNKTIFGAIVGERAVLNELGLSVEKTLANLGDYYEGVTVDTFVVMPNHIHALLRIAPVEGLPKNRLGEVVGRFKS